MVAGMKPMVKMIPYVARGRDAKARIIPVDFSTGGLSRTDVEVLSGISRAIEPVTSMFAQQQDERMLEMRVTLDDLDRRVGDERLSDYLTLFDVANAPFTQYGSVIRFPIGRGQIPSDHPILEFPDLIDGSIEVPKGRGLYPVDVTFEEVEAFDGTERVNENSSLIRGRENCLSVIMHEELYEGDVMEIARRLERMKAISEYRRLNDCIDATVLALEEGDRDSREGSFKSCVANDSGVGFVVDTAHGTNFDGFDRRGFAGGVVYRENPQGRDFVSRLRGMVPELEREAPWNNKKEFTRDIMPRMVLADVYSWSGSYNGFPMVTTAEALPGDKELMDRIGAVHLMYRNIMEATIPNGAVGYMFREFVSSGEVDRHIENLGNASVVREVLHELGHAMGGVEVANVERRFGDNFLVMEEGRADLFSLWGLSRLTDAGMIGEDDEMAGYYSWIAPALFGQVYPAKNHMGARTMVFNYLVAEGAIVDHGSEKFKFEVDRERMRKSVNSLLGAVGNLRSAGDGSGFSTLFNIYNEQESREEFGERMNGMPSGAGYIFPEFKRVDGQYTNELVWPAAFRDQKRTLGNLIG